MNEIQKHPLKPFIPDGAKLLMLGSFPPDRKRWSMDFYYPNFQNDMWRIFSLVFFGRTDAFVDTSGKSFDKSLIEAFLSEKKIALYDSACEIVRKNGTAADENLAVKKLSDISSILKSMPECIAVAATGRKAAENIGSALSITPPKTGDSSKFTFCERDLYFYVMPSSSRAYPMPLKAKAKIYEGMFSRLNLL